MKKLTVKDLEITLPKIDLLEARTLFGEGWAYNGGELSEVVVYPDNEDTSHPEWGDDETPDRPPHWDDDQDQDQEDDRYDTQEGEQGNDYVPVPNGLCVSGAIDYVMIQQSQNVNQGDTHNELANKYGHEEGKGYNMNSGDFKESVEERFNNVYTHPTEYRLQEALGDDDTYAVCRNDDRSHAYVLDGYDENEGFHYYDPVTGEEGYFDSEDKRDPVIVYPN